MPDGIVHVSAIANDAISITRVEFRNELNNFIKISATNYRKIGMVKYEICGPYSRTENTITDMEAQNLIRVLATALGYELPNVMAVTLDSKPSEPTQ